MEIQPRYEGNWGALAPEEMALLGRKRVCVVGCGALGGYCLEELARLGVGHITAVDGDTFEETNLNRQLLALEDNMGQPKTQVAARRLALVNPEIDVQAQQLWLTAENAEQVLQGHDVVLDAAGDLCTRRTLIAACKALGLPLVIGAISGWNVQALVLPPGSEAYDRLCPPGVEPLPPNGSPAFSPAIAASLQVAETIKLLCGKGEGLLGRVLCADFLRQEYCVVRLA